jgi:hypothetical protein
MLCALGQGGFVAVGRKPPLPSMAALPKRTMRRAGRGKLKNPSSLPSSCFLYHSPLESEHVV